MNATGKYIAWLWDGSDCWAPQILDSEELIALRQRAEEASGGNVEVHAYPLHAYDAMREALERILEPADIVFGEEFDTCRYCGRDYTDENIERADNGENPLYFCPSDDCLGFKARAALALAKGER